VAMWTGVWAVVLLTVLAVGAGATHAPPPGGGGGCTATSPCTVSYTYPWSLAQTTSNPSLTGCSSGSNVISAGPSANRNTGQAIIETTSQATVCQAADITTTENFYGPDWTAPAGTFDATFTFWWYVTWTANVGVIAWPGGATCTAVASASYHAYVNYVNIPGQLSASGSRTVVSISNPVCSVGVPYAYSTSGTGPNDISFTSPVAGGYTYQPITYMSTYTEASCVGLCNSNADFNLGTNTNSATFYQLIITYWG